MLPIARLAAHHDRHSYAAVLRDALSWVVSRLQRGQHVLDVVPMRNLFIPGEIGHLHPHPEIIINCIGHGHLDLIDSVFDVRPETLVLTPRGVAHDEYPTRNDACYANIILSCQNVGLGSHIRITEAHNKSEHGHMRQRFVFQDQRFIRAARYVDEACLAYGDSSDKPNALCRGLSLAACALLVEALEEIANDVSTEEDANTHLIQLARAYIEQHIPDYDLRVSKVAERIGCSADYLSHRFHQVTGQHLNAWITERRLDLACNLLRETSMGVEEVARATGYQDPGYFSRCFRAAYGSSPRAWRKSLA